MELLHRDRTVLAIVDMQERLLDAFPDDRRAEVIKHTLIALDAAIILGVPVVVSEQYPKGLGPTIPQIRERMGERFEPIEKLVFSCGRSPQFTAALDATHRKDVLLTGVESHICVLQTAVDLMKEGYRVYVAADAVRSRRDLDWQRALSLLENAGAIVGTTEMFVFQLLERAGTDEFKAVSKLVK
jgi:nicotinamidase-related amidase